MGKKTTIAAGKASDHLFQTDWLGSKWNPTCINFGLSVFASFV